MSAQLVSVILPTFNRSEWIARAIESVLNQTYKAFELIVVDDGSTDETAAVLRPFGARIRVLRQEHLGPYAARNLALRHAKGDLIAFADSDDIWHPNKLAKQVPLLSAPDIGLVFADMALLNGSRTSLLPIGRSAFSSSRPARGSVMEAFAQGNFVPTLTVLVRRICLDEIRGFEQESRLGADYLAWVKIARRWRFDYVDAPLADCTVHAGSISYDLGRSLAARIALFQAELARTSGRDAGVLRRILATLGVQLTIAVPRGRAASVDQPLKVAGRALLDAGPKDALRAIAGLAVRQVYKSRRRSAEQSAS